MIVYPARLTLCDHLWPRLLHSLQGYAGLHRHQLSSCQECDYLRPAGTSPGKRDWHGLTAPGKNLRSISTAPGRVAVTCSGWAGAAKENHNCERAVALCLNFRSRVLRHEEPMNPKKTILVAGQDENDFTLMKTAFASLTSEIVLQRVCNGEEVIRYLKREGRYGDREQYPFPRLLLLDLKKSGKEGFEVLNWIRSHPVFKTLIVTILSESASKEDIAKAYDNAANSYLVKPRTVAELASMARKIKEYWLELNIHSLSPNDT